MRAYTYIEVRSADLVRDDRAFQVPTFWTGLLYSDNARRDMLDRCAGFDDHALWQEVLHEAAKHGLDATINDVNLRELAAEAIRWSIVGLHRGAPCSGDGMEAARPLLALARLHELNVE